MAVVTNIPAPAGLPRLRGGGYEESSIPDPPISSPQARVASEQIDGYIKADQPDQAMAVLQALIDSGQCPPTTSRACRSASRSPISPRAWTTRRYDLATRAGDAPGGRAAVPMLDWNAGLAAFRLGNYDEAAKHFEILAQVGSVPNWRARAGRVLGGARAYARRAIRSASSPCSAPRRARSRPSTACSPSRCWAWTRRRASSIRCSTAASFARLMQIAAGASRRGALCRSARTPMSTRETEARLRRERSASSIPAFAALARRMDVPNIELRASETAASRGIVLTGLFPVPQYKPDGGYTIDPSLVLAFTRAESRFHAEAVSSAGARGLMQLMPATADADRRARARRRI